MPPPDCRRCGHGLEAHVTAARFAGALVIATVAVVLIGGVMKSIPAVETSEVTTEDVAEDV